MTATKEDKALMARARVMISAGLKHKGECTFCLSSRGVNKRPPVSEWSKWSDTERNLPKSKVFICLYCGKAYLDSKVVPGLSFPLNGVE